MGSVSRRLLALGAVLWLGCTSPTLPLPPPALPTIGSGLEPSTFVLKSDRGALPNALILVINRNESLPSEQRVAGTFADNLGSWQLSIEARAGDVVDITQQDGTISSPSISVELK